MASDVVSTVRPDVSVRPVAQSSRALRWLTVTSPRTTRTSGPESGPVSGAVTVPVIVTSLPGPTTAGVSVSSTTTATSLAGTTAARWVADEPGRGGIRARPGRGRDGARGRADGQAECRERRCRGGQPAHEVAPAAPPRVGTPRPSKDHAVPASRFHAACAMRRSLGKVSLRCTSSSRIQATSMASWSGSFSMDSSPPVASRR